MKCGNVVNRTDPGSCPSCGGGSFAGPTSRPKVATIGSSDVAAILGLSPWSSPWSAWTRLVGLVPRYSSTDTAAQSRGRWMEPALAARYAQDRDVEVWPGPQIGQEPLIGPEPWMHARPDYFARSTKAGAWLLEVKTTRTYDGWGPDGSDKAPTYYLVQCVWEAVVCSSELVDLVSYATIDEEQRIYPVRPSDRLRRSIVNRVRDWREAYVLTGEPPPIDSTDGCTAGLLARFPVAVAKMWREATREDLALAADLARVRRQIDELKAEKVEIENRFRERIGDAYGLRADKKQIATWGLRKGSATIDADRLRAELPDVAAKYTTVGKPSRSFRFPFDTQGDSE